MKNKMALIKDGLKFFLSSRQWIRILIIIIAAITLSFAFIYQAGPSTETNLVNAITIITTILAFALLFSDFHRNWRESREKRLTTVFYQKSNNNGDQPIVMIYYRATLGGESDIRALSQQLGTEIIKLGIGENKGYAATHQNLSTASNHYITMPKILQDEKGIMVQDHIGITALYDWVGTICQDCKDSKSEKDNFLAKQKTRLEKEIADARIYFAQGDTDESSWGFKTWDEITKQIDPEIAAKIEAYAKEKELLQFIQKQDL